MVRPNLLAPLLYLLLCSGCTEVTPQREAPAPAPADSADADGDGYDEQLDCNDADPAIHPGASEVCGDGIDNDCDGGVDDAAHCLSSCEAAAAFNSYLGCEYVALDLPNFYSPNLYAISVANPSASKPAHVIISGPGGIVHEATIAPKSVDNYTVADRDATQLDGPGVFDRVYFVTSDIPIAVYQFNSFDTIDSASTDASLLFPTHALSDRYYTMDYDTLGSGDSYIAVAATADGTTVNIEPSDGGAAANATLQRGQVLVYRGGAVTLTGSSVTASAPVAVFSGNECTNVPKGTSYCDHLEQQIFPRQAMGQRYVVARSGDREACTVQDHFRILADSNDTVVNINPPVAGPFDLDAGEWVEFATDQSFEVSASDAVLVGQFLRSSGGQECDNQGDPAFALQIPFDQFRSSYVVMTPPTYAVDYLGIIAAQGTTVTLDGQPLQLDDEPIGTTSFRRTSVVVSDGSHTIEASEPIGIVVTGYDYNVSYAYPAGLNLTAINPVE